MENLFTFILLISVSIFAFSLGNAIAHQNQEAAAMWFLCFIGFVIINMLANWR